jgi:predicted dehydrogenase
MRTIKAAVIGAGFIGPAHIEALRRIDGVEVVAVASNNVKQAEQIAEKYALTHAYHSWEECVRDDSIEVIHNCTPNNLHFEINKAVMQRGKHIVSEKPLTLTSDESEDLVKLARETGVVNAINFNYRFYPLIQHARSMVHKGDLGAIYLVHGQYLQDWLYYDTDYNWRLESRISGVSRAVADIGSHWCDLVQFVTGSKIQRVCANLFTVHEKRKKPKAHVATFRGKEIDAPAEFEELSIDTEDGGSILVQFDSGAHGVFTVSQVSAGRKNYEWFEVDGSKKAIHWNQEEPNSLWIGYRDKPNEVIIKDPALMDEPARKYAHYPGGHPEGYPDCLKNLFMNVYDFIRRGKDPAGDEKEFPTFEDGHTEIKIVEAILRSNKEQKWIDIE